MNVQRLALIMCWLTSVSNACAATLLHETFADDPRHLRAYVAPGGNPARFDYASGGLTADYNTSMATTKLYWPLGRTIDAAQSFRLEVSATLLAEDFFADPIGFAQLAFGLVNPSAGDDRAGGDGGDAFEIVTVDYFPNVSPLFGGPTLAPTVIGADDGRGFFSNIQFPFGSESSLDDEGAPPLDVPLNFDLEYTAETSLLTLRIAANGVPLPLNANQPETEPGGLDGDSTTIQLQLNPGTAFSVDRFAILLWEDTFLPPGATPSVRARVHFEEIRVTVPDSEVTGDTNGDGLVDLVDLNNVRNVFGALGNDVLGDTVPRDGIVDLDDLNRVRNNFGAGSSPSVPEPATILLAASALLPGIVYHRRHRQEFCSRPL